MLIVAQIIGLGAVALYLLSFQLKKRSSMVVATCASNCLYVLQYLLLGAVSGAVLDILSTVSSFFASKKNTPGCRRFAKCIFLVMLFAIVAAGCSLAIVRKSTLELLSVAGALLQTGGLWFEKEQTIRKFALAGAPFWLVYNFVSMAYGAAVGTILTMISAMVGIFRFRQTQT